MPVDVGVTKQLIRDFLLADQSIRDATDGRVFSAHVSSADAPTLLAGKPVLVFDLVGGFARYLRESEEVNLEVYAYSKRGADEAITLYDLTFARLQSERVAVTGVDLVGIARETQRPIAGYNEPIGAWFLRGRWTINAV